MTFYDEPAHKLIKDYSHEKCFYDLHDMEELVTWLYRW